MKLPPPASTQPEVPALLEAAAGLLRRSAVRPGVLYVVATPIGNLADITLRALATLNQCDRILCEDTRVTAKLLNHFAIHKPLVSCYREREVARLPEILAWLAAGEALALVSDAGTPAIRDPGAAVVDAVLAAGFSVETAPGPSALTAAISVAGEIGERFEFAGYAPRRPAELADRLRAMGPESPALMVYETPHRLYATLSALTEEFAARRLILLRELTKLHGQRWAGTLAEFSPDAVPDRGEMVLIFPPPVEALREIWDDQRLRREAEPLRAAGYKPRPLAAELARRSGRIASEIYALLVIPR